jgi:hypothetical protein
MFVDPEFGTCFMSHLCRMGFEVVLRFCLKNVCTPGLAYTRRATVISQLPETQEL